MRSALVPLLSLVACAAPAPEPGPSETGRAFVQGYAGRTGARLALEPVRVLATPDREQVSAPYTARAERRGLVPAGDELVERLSPLATDDAALARRLETPLAFAELRVLVWLRHPGVAAARAELRASIEQLDQASFLEELLGAYRGFVRESNTRVGPQKNRPMAAMEQPYPASVALRGEWVAAGVEMAWERLRRAVRESQAGAWRAAAAWHFARASARIAREQIAVLEKLEPVVRNNVSAGLGSLADLLAVRGELERQRAELAAIGDRVGVARARLRSALHLSRGAELAGEALAPVPESALAAAPATWTALALAERQEVREHSALLRRLAAAIRLAELMSIPRAGLGAVRGAFTPDRPMLPQPAWHGTREALIRELRERESAAGARLEQLRDATGVSAEQARAAHAVAWRDRALYTGELVPLAEQALESVQAAYDGNRARFPDVIAAVRRVLGARLGLARAERDLMESRAGALSALGRDPQIEGDGR